MKANMLRLFLVFLFTTISSFFCANAAWEIVYTNSEVGVKTVKELKFLNDNVGFALMQEEQILKTTDGGSHWTSITLPTGCVYKSMYFIDELNGYVVGNGGKIYKTKNGGVSWVGPLPISVGTTTGQNPFTRFLNYVHFVNNTTGYALGNFGTFLKTTDGGDHWTRKFNELTTEQHHFYSASFYNDSVAYIAAAYGYTYKFKGDSLHKVFNKITTNAESFGIETVGDTTVFVVGRRGAMGDILRSGNSGDFSYKPVEQIFNNYSETLRSIAFKDQLNGYVVGDNGRVLFTTTGGETWREDTDENIIPAQFLSVCYTPNGTIFMSGVNVIMRQKSSQSALNKVYENNVRVYPNPVKNNVNISFGDEQAIISILDMTGKTVLSPKIINSGTSLSLSSLNSGVYIMKVATKGSIVLKKINKF